MTGAWIPLLGILGVVTTGLGFATNRSDPGILGPAIRPLNPKFKTDHRTPVDVFLNRKIIDNILGDVEAKNSAKENENCTSCSDDPPRFGRSDEVVHEENRVTINEKNATDSKESTESSSTWKPRTSDVTTEKKKSLENGGPRNVVLVLVDDAGSDRESAWKSFGTAGEFTVQGFLQNCQTADLSEGFKFSLSESLVSNAGVQCECDRLLREKIGSLLTWAHHTKNMATGAVSASNFSILSPPIPIQVIKDLDDSDEANPLNQEARRTHPDIRANWRLVELQKQPGLSSSTPIGVAETATKSDGPNGYDGMWDVFDMFSRIRMAFFRILLESLGNLSGNEDDFPGRRPFPAVQPSVAQLVSDTVRKFKTMPNDEGFMMVVTSPGNEVPAVVETLRSEVSFEDTLLVIAGWCSTGNEPVAFFATGPGGKALQETRVILDLPDTIRSVISSGCGGDVCKNKRREEPLARSSLEWHSLSHDTPRKRVVRAKEEDETTTSRGDDNTTKDFVETETEADDKMAETEKEKRSGAEISRVDNVAAILGIATSVTAMLALNS